VDEEWRKKGIGRRLLDMSAHLETPLGARSNRMQIELNVHTKNPNARSYYEHMGFKVPARNSWVSDAQGTVVAVVMRKA
jgi:GNAT superfamily N-acetyltransferase